MEVLKLINCSFDWLNFWDNLIKYEVSAKYFVRLQEKNMSYCVYPLKNILRLINFLLLSLGVISNAYK